MEDFDEVVQEEELSYFLKIITSAKLDVQLFQELIFDLLRCRKGKCVIEALLQTEAEPSGSLTPEEMVTSNTKKQIVQLFVNLAGNCTFYDCMRRQTVLHFASKYGWIGIVQSLLKKGADPNVKDFLGETPLMLATLSLRKGVADLLIESGADVLCRSDANCTLLHAAAEKGWLELVQSLLSKGIDPNTATEHGFTPLDFAIQGSNKDVVSLLMDSGSKLDSCKLSRETLLDFATREGHLQVLQDLVEKAGPKNSPILKLLSVASSHTQIETIEYLAKQFSMITGCDDTPLQFLNYTCFPNPLLVQLFIERGAYFDCYSSIISFNSLKVRILRNIELTTQAIINKFNNKDLPDLFKLPLSVKEFPTIETLTIKSRDIIQDIKQSVRSEIETNGFCNVLKPKVILLRMMAAKAYIDHYDDPKKRSQLNRSATVNSGDQAFNKLPNSRIFRCVYGENVNMNNFLHRF